MQCQKKMKNDMIGKTKSKFLIFPLSLLAHLVDRAGCRLLEVQPDVVCEHPGNMLHVLTYEICHMTYWNMFTLASIHSLKKNKIK